MARSAVKNLLPRLLFFRILCYDRSRMGPVRGPGDR